MEKSRSRRAARFDIAWVPLAMRPQGAHLPDALSTREATVELDEASTPTGQRPHIAASALVRFTNSPT